MKQCELCKSPANVYCESDGAILCWDCDRKVHGANFLVAKHTRTLLCYSCQNPTPWRGSGVKFSPTVSVCGECLKGCDRAELRIDLGQGSGEGVGDEYNYSDDDVDEHGEEDYGGEEDEEENQVVPWASSTTPPPISRNSYTDEGSSSRSSGCREATSMNSRSRKRSRNNDKV